MSIVNLDITPVDATITINGDSVPAMNGNIAIYAKREFIYDGTK